ncbi:TPA: nucleotidyl transferase AbiEii/AbiGii toxin family protein [Candidatus Micrarchaeota archaeon]|nr:nucleotidyl transferase AbiEii/AbiGii toxin family protein [Candidatus Micrarchaeota archaeon]
MIEKDRLYEVAKKLGLKIHQQEQHYMQTITLFGIYSYIANELVFKGGTALFFFYGLDRFSEDLDFTLTNEFEEEKLLESIKDTFGLLAIEMELKEVKSIAGKNYKIKAKGPAYTNEASISIVNVEISDRKDVVLNPEIKQHVPVYEDIKPFFVPIMSAGEILAEKVRAIMNRNKARDVYDLAFLLRKGAKFDIELINKKTEYYKENFVLDVFEEELRKKERNWKTDLHGLIKYIPDFEETASYILTQANQSK